jgi:hypothetical protein
MNVRRIGLTVEQPRNGVYYWVLHEDVRQDGHYERIEAAERAYVTYAAALAEGYGMMQRMTGLHGLPA